MSKEDYLEKALKWVKQKSSDLIQSVHPDYDDPKSFTNKATNQVVVADFSFTNRGKKSYTDIALKTAEPQKLVTRWKLLSTLANMKNGTLYLLAPKGHIMFTQRLVKKYNINATVKSL